MLSIAAPLLTMRIFLSNYVPRPLENIGSFGLNIKKVCPQNKGHTRKSIDPCCCHTTSPFPWVQRDKGKMLFAKAPSHGKGINSCVATLLYHNFCKKESIN